MAHDIVRIKDIATRAGVSPGTVDRVLHNRGRVSRETTERILKIIAELEYQPNLGARALGSNRIYRLAALLPDPTVDPYWQAPRKGVDQAEKDLKQYGITVEKYIFDPYKVHSFVEQASQVREAKPDGILLAPIYYREALPFFRDWNAQAVPFVLFNTQLSDYNPLCYIGQDSYQSGLLAAKLAHYGQQAGSIALAHIDEDISNSAHLIRKEEGFNDYFRKKNLKLFNIIRCELNRSDTTSFHHQLDELLDSHPDLKTIYVTSSKAYAIASWLEQKGRMDVNLIGYDLIPENIAHLKKGNIKFLINQNSKGQGYWGIYQLTHYLALKQKIDPVKYLPLDIITNENLESYGDFD